MSRKRNVEFVHNRPKFLRRFFSENPEYEQDSTALERKFERTEKCTDAENFLADLGAAEVLNKNEEEINQLRQLNENLIASNEKKRILQTRSVKDIELEGGKIRFLRTRARQDRSRSRNRTDNSEREQKDVRRQGQSIGREDLEEKMGHQGSHIFYLRGSRGKNRNQNDLDFEEREFCQRGKEVEVGKSKRREDAERIDSTKANIRKCKQDLTRRQISFDFEETEFVAPF